MQVYIKPLICNWRNKSHAGLERFKRELEPISKRGVSLQGWELSSASRLNKFRWRFTCPQLGLKSNTSDSRRVRVNTIGNRTEQNWNETYLDGDCHRQVLDTPFNVGNSGTDSDLGSLPADSGWCCKRKENGKDFLWIVWSAEEIGVACLYRPPSLFFSSREKFWGCRSRFRGKLDTNAAIENDEPESFMPSCVKQAKCLKLFARTTCRIWRGFFFLFFLTTGIQVHGTPLIFPYCESYYS